MLLVLQDYHCRGSHCSSVSGERCDLPFVSLNAQADEMHDEDCEECEDEDSLDFGRMKTKASTITLLPEFQASTGKTQRRANTFRAPYVPLSCPRDRLGSGYGVLGVQQCFRVLG